MKSEITKSISNPSLTEDMECLTCGSNQLQRNGYRNKIQCYRCKCCGRQFLESYKQVRYSQDIKDLCIRMYFKGMSARRIEKLTDIHHTTISSWIRDLDASNLVVFKENEFDRIDRPMYARL
ncbi:MAG: hypothetical protein KME17_28285 [Cyanosarcina radialis HA8281-LM2]|nr:hypothetical protein [Cyanosarcina radialis HA8281-LM2]